MRTARRPSRRTRLAGLALLGPLVLGVGACGTDATDDPSTVEAGSPDAVVSATASTPTPSTPSGSTGASSSAPSGTSLGAAAQAALDEVDGTVFAVERGDDGGWEVTVVTGDGKSTDVSVSADGAVSGTADGKADADDQDLLDASVDYAAAIAVAEGSAPDATVTGLEFSEESGLATWTVELDAPDGTGQTLQIDASSAVIREATDD